MAYAAPSIRASGTTFSLLRSGGLVGLLRSMLTVNLAATAAPTAAATATATGGGATGGLLAAGDYYFRVTETNGLGETTANTESAKLTVASGNIPRVTFAALKTGNTARNLYLTAAGGATGTEVLYASGITAGTYDLAVAAPASTVVPPTTSTTGISQADADRVAKLMARDETFQRLKQNLDNWLNGSPIPAADLDAQLQTAAVAAGMLKAAIDELGTLVDANPGTIGSTINSQTGLLESHRTWS